MKRQLLTGLMCFLAAWAWAAKPETAHRQKNPPPVAQSQAKKPREYTLYSYNREEYQLAFDALVAANELADALVVAQEGIKHEPENPDWHLRLAKVAEWNGHPELAWRHRLWLHQHGYSDRETREALLRLGWAFGSPEMLLDLWLQEARNRPLTHSQWKEVRQLFEASFRAKEGARYFVQRFRQTGEIQFLDWAAELTERAGQDEEALRLYLERAEREPFSLASLISAATLLIRRDQLREAHQLLSRFTERIPENEREYWRLLANVAWEIQDFDSSERAYRRFLAQAPERTDVWSRLISLLQMKNSFEAAQLALSVYRRQGNRDFLIWALELSKNLSLAEQAAIFAALTPEDLALFEGDARFLLLRASYQQRAGQFSAAWRDIEQALAIAPESADVVAAAIWFFLDRRKLDRLPELLARWQERAQNNSALWLPFAAALHALDRYREAVPWYQKEIERQPSDLLLQLNYADLLERLQQPGEALRIRQQAWRKLQEDTHKKAMVHEGKVDTADLLALARLTLLDRPGDQALQLIQKVANRLRDLGDRNQGDEQAKDLILAWAIGSAQYLNARSWLWLNYLRQNKAAPTWGEAQTALQVNDLKTLQQLIETRKEAMPIYNRYDSAYALDQRQHALDIAFHGMEKNPNDEPLHDRYRLHAPHASNYLQFAWHHERLGDYRAANFDHEMHLNLTPRLAVNLTWSGLGQSSGEPALDAFAPDRDKFMGIEAQWRGTRGTTRLSLFRREELDRFIGWRLAQTWRWDRRLNLEGILEQNGEATDNVPLRIGSKQNGLRLNANYILAKREAISLGTRWSEYTTQLGDPLGSGIFFDLGVTYRLRTEYPDWRLRATYSIARYQYERQLGALSINTLAPEVRTAITLGSVDAVRYFLPESSRTVGLCLGMGENLAGQDLRTVYSRSWRPYYELCGTHNDITGLGFRIDLGLVGSVSGEDHLVLEVGQSAGSVGNLGTNRHLQLRYRHYF